MKPYEYLIAVVFMTINSIFSYFLLLNTKMSLFFIILALTILAFYFSDRYKYKKIIEDLIAFCGLLLSSIIFRIFSDQIISQVFIIFSITAIILFIIHKLEIKKYSDRFIIICGLSSALLFYLFKKQ